MLLPFIEFVLPIFILLFINIVLEYDKSDFGTQLASIISLILSQFAFFIVTSKDSAKEASFKMIEIIAYAPLASSLFCIVSVLTNSNKYLEDGQAPFFIVNSIIAIIVFILVIILFFNAMVKKYCHHLVKKQYVSVDIR